MRKSVISAAVAASTGIGFGSISMAAIIPSNATVIASDGFNYTPNGASLATATDGGGDSGFTNHWSLLSNGTTYTDGSITTSASLVDPSTGITYSTAATLTGGSFNAVDYRQLSAPPPSTPGTVVYVSYLFKDLLTTSGRGTFMSLYNTSATQTNLGAGGVTDLLDFGKEGVNEWGFFPADTGGVSVTTSPAENGNTTLITAELDYNGGGHDSIEVYLNTNSTPILQESNLTLTGPLGFLRIFAGGNPPGSNASSDFSDVTVAYTPEPATLGLLLPAGLMLTSRRWGRRPEAG
jgi:hypothetical protein